MRRHSRHSVHDDCIAEVANSQRNFLLTVAGPRNGDVIFLQLNLRRANPSFAPSHRIIQNEIENRKVRSSKVIPSHEEHAK